MTDNETDRRFYRNMAAFHLFAAATVVVPLTGAWVTGGWHSGRLLTTTAATLLVAGQLLLARARWRDYRRALAAEADVELWHGVTVSENTTSDDLSRDLAADLALCEAASEGPWSHGLDLDPPDSGIEAANGGCVAHMQDHGNVNTVARTGEEFSHADARFVAASREGWPAAIRRALTAEADVELWHAATLDREEIIERQAAEVERLKAALRDIADMWVVGECDDWVGIAARMSSRAEEALEAKP